MPRRTQIYQQIPWVGGINTSVDPGILPPNDLIQADNVVFTSSGARVKREGFDFFDTAIPASTYRSSSGTARTIVFASTINVNSAPYDHILVSGEHITVTGGPANYNTTAGVISSISTTSVTNDTITYTFAGAGSLSESSTATSAIVVTKRSNVIGVHDYWYFVSANNAKSQYLVAVTEQGKFYRYDSNGKRREVVMSGSGATALAVSTLTSVDIRTYNNLCVFTMSGVGNTPKYYDAQTADEWKDLATNTPDASIMQEHQGRLFMNDKTRPDYLHFSSTFDHTEWLGIGDSGAILVAEGDGDALGINAIMPSFKNRLILTKAGRTFQVAGDAPEEYFIQAMSNGIGAISHKSAVAVDLDDLFYFSRRGVHSIKSTDTYGDFAGSFLSRDIQPTYNTWSDSNRKYSQGVYIPNLNCVAWTVSENGQTDQNALWLFNPFIKNAQQDPGVWFRWPDLNPQSVCVASVSGKPRIVIGNNNGRILRGQNTEYVDRDTDGITFRVKTGTIYPDNNSQSIKGFKKFGILYKPVGSISFTAYFKVGSLPVQTLSFSQSQVGDRLGSAFVLGSSELGNTSILAPYMKDVVGFGRGFSVEIFQTGSSAQVEIYGFLVEYELADIADEVTQEG